ncbi:MAG: putative toxin-antitoxin system toxin component, PIN family [bacterium]
MIVVLDTNIYISGTFWLGISKRIIRKAKERGFVVVVSEEMLDELKDVLTRKDKDFKLSNEEAGKIIKDITSYAKIVKPSQKVTVCRDKKDNMVIECAIAGRARYIISGDYDLKALGKYNEIEMIDAYRFLEILEGAR